MTSFVHINYPVEHPGVARAEAAIAAAGRLRQGFDGTRGLAALLLGAIVAALMVVADQVVDAWTGGHLLTAWLVLWIVAVAALGLFAGTARRAASSVMRRLDAWSLRVARTRADERLWATAKADPRVMADLEAAIFRSEVAAPRMAQPAPARRSLRDLYQDWLQEMRRARSDQAFRAAVETDPRMRADLQAVRGRAEAASDVPDVTRTLQRADEAADRRNAAQARGSRYAYDMM